jgi:hypothetical protein
MLRMTRQDCLLSNARGGPANKSELESERWNKEKSLLGWWSSNSYLRRARHHNAVEVKDEEEEVRKKEGGWHRGRLI